MNGIGSNYADEKSSLEGENIPRLQVKESSCSKDEDGTASRDSRLNLTNSDRIQLSAGSYGCPCSKGRVFNAIEEALHRNRF